MAGYTLEIKRSALKELDALDDVVFARIDSAILALAGNPRPERCKKFRGYKNLWRVRTGDWRVVYTIDDSEKLVTRVAHRREVYE